MRISFIALLLFFIAIPTQVNADIALLLHEATGFSGETTGAGHVTVYLSNVCTDPPLVLRPCHANEPKGVVIATYPSFSDKADYKWFVMPIMPYLYGVESGAEIPLYANGKVRSLLRETNRAKYLSKIITPSFENEMLPPGRWEGVVGAGLNRDLYAFTVKTTAEQDARFLEKYNNSPKGNNFHALYRNCADFTRDVMNFYFPKSASRDFINDFGITTPKALARSFSRYAAERPDLLFYITKYPQIDGTILRSFGIRNFTETAFTSKKYFITQSLTMPILLPVFAGTYLLTGYFNIDSAYRNYPSTETARLNLLKRETERQTGGSGKKETLADIKRRQKSEQTRIFGEKAVWEHYRREFSPLLEKAIKGRLFADQEEVKTFFRDLEDQSEPFFDETGKLMLKTNNYGEVKFLGLTRTNIIAANSDVRLAYKLMLAKVKYQLSVSAGNREALEVFQKNWQLLIELSKRNAALPPINLPNNARFLTTPRVKTFKTKVLQAFRVITH